jgi:hypothetical protein
VDLLFGVILNSVAVLTGFRNPPGAWVLLCCVCCVLSVRGPCDELITRQEESHRL